MKPSRLILAILLGFCLCLAAASHCLAQNTDAVVRVQAGNSLGSGTVFYRSANGDAYILTNHHVAGRTGSRVAIEFWANGRLQPKRPGVVVQAHLDGGYTDVAIVRVSAADLGSLNPPYIPLAPPGSRVAVDQQIRSRGCPGGVWQCQFIGHTRTTPESVNDRRMEFYPRPGGGRSGSSLLTGDGNEIAGLVTWSAEKPGHQEHGVDGFDYQSGFGIAQQVDTIWAVIRGQIGQSVESRPDHYQELGLAVHPPQELDPAQILRRPWLRPRSPEPESPTPQPPSEPLPGLPFDMPPSGPLAEPDFDDPPGEQPQDDGLLRRRYGDPQPRQPGPQEPEPELEDELDGLIFGRQQSERVGPLRRMVRSVVGFFRITIFLLAAYGGWCLLVKLRRVSAVVVPTIAICILAATPAAAQDAYRQQLEPIAKAWQQQPVSQASRWLTYEEALRASKDDQQPVLVMATMAGCKPCETLKRQLAELDREGWLNTTHLCLIDAERDAELIERFAVEAFPALIACHWIDGELRPGRSHVGLFGTPETVTIPIPQTDYFCTFEIASLDEWLLLAGIK